MKAVFSRVGLKAIADFHPGDVVCREGEKADGCWVILEGTIEVRHDGTFVHNRSAGELIGEQAFLKTLKPGGSATRTATLMARTNVRLLKIDAALHEQMSTEELATWFLTLAAVVNDKLEQATGDRSKLQQLLQQRDALLSRFADDGALGIVKLVARNSEATIEHRKVIIWFSDIAGFSTWSLGKPAVEIAKLARTLQSVQIDLIRSLGGTIDKLMGDGLMAFWFIDTAERRKTHSLAAIDCALQAATSVASVVKDAGANLDIRIGLHAGDVAFGDFGARERIAVTILGQAVNLAARYEQARSSHLGRVRISSALRDLALSEGHDLSTFRGPIADQVKSDTITIYTR
jgi:class 3 adenylate cyclase